MLHHCKYTTRAILYVHNMTYLLYYIFALIKQQFSVLETYFMCYIMSILSFEVWCAILYSSVCYMYCKSVLEM